MRPFTSRSAIIVASILLSAATLFAQDLDNVTITGNVTDESGALVVGALVTVSSTETGLTRSGKTDQQGRYVFTQISPGIYLLAVSSDGFATSQRNTERLVAGQHLVAHVVLSPQQVIANTVVVSGPATRIDTARTVVGSTIERRDLDSLPLHSRSALDLVFTLPGVTDEPLSTRELAEDRDANHANTPEEAGKFAIAGGPAYSNNLTIDGLDNNDDRTARERFEPSLEAIDEVQVISNQFAAEYGRASGGRINIRTRGGTNSFHGRGYYFFRDEALNANPTGAKETDVGNIY